MLKMVDGTGIIGVDMICPLGVSTPQPPNYDRVELEGTGMLVLPNSLDAPLERLELGGKTEQAQTTGAQLFDIAKCPLEHNGISFKIPKSSGDVVLMDGYVFEENAQYTISAQKTTSKNENSAVFKFEYADGSRNEIKVKDIAKKSLTSMSGKTVKRFLVVNPFGAVDEVFNFQFEKGVTATPYEPYTGGKPSPSPEYPQEIKNVGKWNEETQKYEVDVKVTGKNLFDKDSVKKGYEFSSVASDMESPKEGWFVSDFISVTEGKVYISGKSTGGVCKLYNKDKLFVKNIQATSGQLTIEGGISYFRLNGETKDLNNIQVELGSAKTPYEPYRKLQTLTLTSDRPITKWDRLVEQGGEIGWLYQSAVKEYIGDDSVALYDTGFYFKLSDKKIVNGEGYCKELKQYVSREKNPCINFNMTPNIYAYVLNTQAIYGSTVSAIKEYLKSHPLHLAYKTEIPEFIPLPQSEQSAIRALKTYYPTTVITADGGELDPDIKATYRKEI